MISQVNVFLQQTYKGNALFISCMDTIVSEENALYYTGILKDTIKKTFFLHQRKELRR